jgi:hypothetical protein
MFSQQSDTLLLFNPKELPTLDAICSAQKHTQDQLHGIQFMGLGKMPALLGCADL